MYICTRNLSLICISSFASSPVTIRPNVAYEMCCSAYPRPDMPRPSIIMTLVSRFDFRKMCTLLKRNDSVIEGNIVYISHDKSPAQKTMQ